MGETIVNHDRVDRLESIEAIRALSHRYAQTADLRDIDGLLDLFVDDVNCGRWGTGRAALRSFYEVIWRGFYRSLHAITSITVDIVDDDHATGTVFMRAEHEVTDRWVVMGMVLFDWYERRDEQWYFTRRKQEFLFSHDHLERPQEARFSRSFAEEPRSPTLPHSRASWQNFWSGHAEAAARLSRLP